MVQVLNVLFSQIGVISALINSNLRHQSLKNALQVTKSKAIICGHELRSGISKYSNVRVIKDLQNS